MRTNTKPVYTWYQEQGQELPVGVMPVVKRKGMVCACWNDLTGKWELGESDGSMWKTIWNHEAVPAGLRTFLLILGVST